MSTFTSRSQTPSLITNEFTSVLTRVVVERTRRWEVEDEYPNDLWHLRRSDDSLHSKCRLRPGVKETRMERGPTLTRVPVFHSCFDFVTEIFVLFVVTDLSTEFRCKNRPYMVPWKFNRFVVLYSESQEVTLDNRQVDQFKGEDDVNKSMQWLNKRSTCTFTNTHFDRVHYELRRILYFLITCQIYKK